MKWPQYSLAYLLLEVFWVAACVAMMKLAIDSASGFRFSALAGDAPIATVLSALCAGAAIGGLFHRMGMVIGACVAFVVSLGAVAPIWFDSKLG